MTRPGFAVLALLAIACRPSTESSGRAAPAPAPSVSFEVGRVPRRSPTSLTFACSSATRASLLTDVSTDGTTLLFESAPASIRSIAPGDVLLIKGLLARKVLDVDAQGAQVAVLTTRHARRSHSRWPRRTVGADPVHAVVGERDTVLASPRWLAVGERAVTRRSGGARPGGESGEIARRRRREGDRQRLEGDVLRRPRDGRMDIALTMTRDVGVLQRRPQRHRLRRGFRSLVRHRRERWSRGPPRRRVQADERRDELHLGDREGHTGRVRRA